MDGKSRGAKWLSVGADHSHFKQHTHVGPGGGAKAAGGGGDDGGGGGGGGGGAAEGSGGAAAGGGGAAAGESRMTVPQRRWGLAWQYLWIMHVSARARVCACVCV